MSVESPHTAIEHTNGGTVELRHFDDPGSAKYRSWKMPVNEAIALAKWWSCGGMHIKKRELPVDRVKSGRVLVSMCTLKLVDVQAIAPYGRPTLRRYSLPREVVDSLAAFIGRDAHITPQKGAL